MDWRTGRIEAIVRRSPRLKSFFFALPEPLRFRPGQHVALRLTAPDGYRAQRLYSIASAPESAGPLELAIERLDDGEVSPFFHDVAEVGDAIEIGGPIGGHFVWSVEEGGPVLLIGGGSGLVPLLSMVRHRALRGSAVPLTLVASARTTADLIFHDELERHAAGPGGIGLIATLTRQPQPPAGLRAGRVDARLIAEAVATLPARPVLTFVCGSNAFADAAADAAIAAGLGADTIRTERYGE